jgi:SnoaL-like domain
MQRKTETDEIPIHLAAQEGVVLTALAYLKNGQIDDATARFAEQFTFKDHGLELEFKDKERLAEFFHKTRELYPDSWLQTDTIFVCGNHVITEWTVQAMVNEPFYRGLSRQVRVSLPWASVVGRENGKITDWADYYDGLTSRPTALASYFTEWVEL